MRVSVLVPFALLAFMAVARADGSRPIQKTVQHIDLEITRKLTAEKVPASPLASDAEFLRRLYLDLTGKIPTYDRAVAFLDSKDPARRTKLIDELLAAPDFGEHFATTFTNLLLVGDAVNLTERNRFQRWLAEKFNKNHPWDRLVTDLVTAEGTSADNPAVVFVLNHSENNKIQPNMLAAATTRQFLGVQLQCAECHNHPFTGWKQAEFWGVAAFFTRVTNQKGAKGSPGGVTEAAPAAPTKGKKAEATATGAAIVIPSTAGKASGKRIAAKYLEGEEPNLGDQGPYRPALAKWMTAPDNKFFARAAVNRFWAHFFGRGFVHPVDDFHDDNLPSHPALLDALAAEFRASGYDVKHLVRCIVSSQAYQRTSQPLPDNKDDKTLFSHMAVKVMTPEMMYDALVRALGVSQLNINTGAVATSGIGGAKKNQPTNAPRDRFIKFFKTSDADTLPTDYTQGIPQALALMNDPQFNKGTPVVEQLVKAKLPTEQAIEKLYLTVLARRPTPAETKTLSAYIARQPDAARGYTGAVWILLNTQEFVLVR